MTVIISKIHIKNCGKELIKNLKTKIRKIKKRIFGLVLALVMTIGIVPAISFESQAAEATQYEVGD